MTLPGHEARSKCDHPKRQCYRLRPASECPCRDFPKRSCGSTWCARCQGGVIRRRWTDDNRRLPAWVRAAVPRMRAHLVTVRMTADPASVESVPGFLRAVGDALRHRGLDDRITWYRGVDLGRHGRYHLHLDVLAADAPAVAALVAAARTLAAQRWPEAAGPRQ